MDTKIIQKFECRAENISAGKEKPILMFSFYNHEGKYIGNIEHFKNFVIEKGIFPEVYDNNNVCSIGKSEKDGKWYGWSHRAVYGFQIGDTVKKGDCCAESGWTKEYLKDHPDPYVLPLGFTAKTESDCKKMAIAFAHGVS